MTVKEFAEAMNMKVATGENGLDKELKGVYVCDLLSWVMSHADNGDVWITVHTHLNIVAVAVLAEIACVVIPEGICVEQQTIDKAVQEGIPILCTEADAYDICCRAHGLLNKKQV